MSCLIISAGRSIIGKNYSGPWHTRIAINRAIVQQPCDLLVAGDFVTLRDIGQRAPLWTMLNDPCRGALDPSWRAVGRFDLLPGWTDLGRPANWSIQGAIAVAVHLGHRAIDVVGADAYWSIPRAPEDCAGYAGPDTDRTRERWIREHADIDRSIAWAAAQGATVTMEKP